MAGLGPATHDLDTRSKTAGRGDLHVAPEYPAWLAEQTVAKTPDKVRLDESLLYGPARHSDRLKAVKLVAQLLSLLPIEELLEAHRFAQRDVHGATVAASPQHRHIPALLRQQYLLGDDRQCTDP
jgi:hypothetical protein